MADIGAVSMDEQNPNSVSDWIARTKQGEDSAVQHLWDRYFGRMVEVARHRQRRHRPECLLRRRRGGAR